MKITKRDLQQLVKEAVKDTLKNKKLKEQREDDHMEDQSVFVGREEKREIKLTLKKVEPTSAAKKVSPHHLAYVFELQFGHDDKLAVDVKLTFTVIADVFSVAKEAALDHVFELTEFKGLQNKVVIAGK